MSVYGQITPGDGDEDWIEWSDAMDKHYAKLCSLDPVKPVMLAEFGVGEFPDSGSKAEWIQAAFATMNAGRYPRLKAAVFWHERWQNKDESYSDLRVQSSSGRAESLCPRCGQCVLVGSSAGSPGRTALIYLGLTAR